MVRFDFVRFALQFYGRVIEYWVPLFLGVFFRLFFKGKNPFTAEEDIKKLIFIHVPKNAGRSICKDVFSRDGRHVQLKRYYLYDPRKADEYYKFAVVRDPVDRFVSAFNGLKGSATGDGSYDHFVRNNVDIFNDVSDFVDWMMSSRGNVSRVLRWVHFYPQYKWIGFGFGKIKVDRVLRFETLSLEWPAFADEHGFSPDLPFVGRGRKAVVPLSEQQILFIRDIYHKDCLLFSY